MNYRVRFTEEAEDDLARCFDALLLKDWYAAERALAAITKAMDVLREFPFACRKADAANPFLRELVISFGDSGYVALFEIADDTTINIVAVRHQREDDYY